MRDPRRFEVKGALGGREPEVDGVGRGGGDAREDGFGGEAVVGHADDPGRDHSATSEGRDDASGTGEREEETDTDVGELGPGDETPRRERAPGADAVVVEDDGVIARLQESLLRRSQVPSRYELTAPPRRSFVEREKRERRSSRRCLEHSIEHDNVRERRSVIEGGLAGGGDHDGDTPRESARRDDRFVPHFGEVVVAPDDAGATRSRSVPVRHERDPGPSHVELARTRDRERRLPRPTERGTTDRDHAKPVAPLQRPRERARSDFPPDAGERSRDGSPPRSPFKPAGDP